MAVDKLRLIAHFSPERMPEIGCEDPELDELLFMYPALASFEDYVEFLRSYGGAYVSCPAFSLGVYGFSGYTVPSFAEGDFVAEDHYFNFADIQYRRVPDAIEFFYFDLRLKKDRAFRRMEGSERFDACRDSFTSFLNWIAGLASELEDQRS